VDELSHVPAIGVHYFVFAGEVIVDLLGFLANTVQTTARHIVVEREDIVMAELHQHQIAGLELRHDLVEQTFCNNNKGTRTAATLGGIDYGDFGRIEILQKRNGLALNGRYTSLFGCGGVAQNIQSRQIWGGGGKPDIQQQCSYQESGVNKSHRD